MKDRRKFVQAAGGVFLLLPLGALAQPSAPKAARIAILSPGANESRSIFTAFRRQLRALGYEEGRDVVLEFHFARGNEQLAALAQDIVRKGVDVVLADGRLAAKAMQAASRTVPVVAVAGEPVLNGLAASLVRPGGNVTGVATMAVELGAKQLEFLREILPAARRIGIVDASKSPGVAYRSFEERAAALRVALRRIVIETQADAERELAPEALRDIDGLVMPANALIGGLIAPLVRLVEVARKPAIYGEKDFVAAGGLVFYGFDIDEAFRRCAGVVDRVLKGADPATTPFEQPTRIGLVVNVKAARALGLRFPYAVIARADEVIQ
ncbi:MAG TPA: ABC transporter substrate-binding protein [Caldimonas sp.]|nr:ABC transporter substrate-binding protein [Caldimonas sp.]